MCPYLLVQTTFAQGKAKGGIYFHSISEVYVDHQKSQAASQRATFIMKTNDRCIHKQNTKISHLHFENKFRVIIEDFYQCASAENYLHRNSNISSHCLSQKQQDSNLESKPPSDKFGKKCILSFCLFQEVLIDGSEPGGHEDLGGRAVHGGRGLPGVPGPRLS